MNKEIISDKQAIAIIVLFMIGESSIFIEGVSAKKDLWIVIILTILITLPLVIIFARLQSLFAQKDLFDIIEICFGKYISKLVIILYTWFAFHLIDLIFNDFGYFVSTLGFPETPKLIAIIFLAVICAYGAKAGIEVLGRCAEFFVIIPIFFEIIVTLMLIPKMNINNIRPVLYEGIKPVMEGIFLSFSFPFGYMVAMTLAFSCFKTKHSPYKVYIWGLLISGIIIFIVSLTDLLVIGSASAGRLYYPTYMAISIIKIGEFIQRLEILSGIVFMIGGFIELTIWIMCACKGITKLFGFKDYRFMVIPISLLAVNLTVFEFKSIIHYFEWSRAVWQYYVFPFEAILPVIIWITAEVKIRKKTDINRIEN